MGNIISGREISAAINQSVREKLQEIFRSKRKRPKLVSLLSRETEDARIYIKMQEKVAGEVGIEFEAHTFSSDITPDSLSQKIEQLNADNTVTAIIVQKPLPEGFNHDKIISGIVPRKDAEGIHPMNLGKILRREADIVPCTPGAVMKILAVHGINLYGKEVVILGHSAIVGKPLSLMMLNEMATTTVCHLGTSEKGDIKSHAKRADILVVAVGKAKMVKDDWVKKGAVVIDVGINKTSQGIVGDVDFDEVSKTASLITPVPGGVGPITVSILMRNVLRSYVMNNV